MSPLEIPKTLKQKPCLAVKRDELSQVETLGHNSRRLPLITIVNA